MRPLLVLPVLVVFLVTAPPLCPAGRAQSTVSDVIDFLVTNQAVPTADFEKDRAAADGARATIARALLVNLASVPLATSSSGFLYRLNPQLGTVERATESFGAFFVERALTPGRGRASLGLTATSSEFDRLDGHSLRDGTMVTVANRFRDETAPFDTESLTLRISSSTLTLFGSIGVTDRLEIGGAVPFVRLTLDGRRVNVYRGQTLLQASGTASTSGVADMAVRAKYTILAARSGGVAAAVEMRLPTGDDRNLLGTGAISSRFMGVGSVRAGTPGASRQRSPRAWGGVAGGRVRRGGVDGGAPAGDRLRRTAGQASVRPARLRAHVGASSRHFGRGHAAPVGWKFRRDVVERRRGGEGERHPNIRDRWPSGVAARAARPDGPGHAGVCGRVRVLELAGVGGNDLPRVAGVLQLEPPAARLRLPPASDLGRPCRSARARGSGRGSGHDHLARAQRDALGGKAVERPRERPLIDRRPDCTGSRCIEIAIGRFVPCQRPADCGAVGGRLDRRVIVARTWKPRGPRFPGRPGAATA